ncbi:MAG: TonB-dependent receptor [Methylococcaceae bacterium]|nr:TonB-dependent receptor [Methylococcaceae bacterium]
MSLHRQPAAVILSFCCPLSYAADEPVDLGEIVVTATRLETPADQLPASTSVIDKEEIESQQITDTLEVLRDIPGFTIVQTGSRGGTTDLFVRGGNANFNQVLIDGVKANQPGGTYDFSDLTTDGVDRIEIVRGPQSALYGSDAVTSVVQLFTRRGEGPLTTSFGFRGGSFETFEESAGISGGTEDYGYTLDVGRIDTAGILAFNNRYGNTSVASRFDWSPAESLDLTTTVRFNDSRFEFPTESAGDRLSPLDANQFQERNRLIVGPRAVWEPYSWWRHTLQLGYYREHLRFEDPFDPDVDFGSFASTTDQERLSADYNSAFVLPVFTGITPTLTLGGYGEKESFEQDSLFLQGVGTPDIIDAGRDAEAFYSQLVLDWDEQASLVGGFRLNHASTYGTVVNPRVGVAYRIPGIETKLRANYGTAIKNPTFFENFGRTSVGRGNPNLAPESAETWEVGFDQTLPFDDYPIELSATYFYSDFDDLIGFVRQNSPNDIAFFNIQKARSRGFEFGIRIETPIGIGFRGSYTCLDTTVLDPGIGGGSLYVQGEPLLRRPWNTGGFTVDYSAGPWTASFNMTVKGDSIDRDFSVDPAGKRVVLKGFAKADIAVDYRVIEKRLGVEALWLTAKAQNVFNENYEEVYGFSTAGANYLLGFRAEL